jgi:hypothetical protein
MLYFYYVKGNKMRELLVVGLGIVLLVGMEGTITKTGIRNKKLIKIETKK